jgi:Uma2 family endonuclease
MMSAMVNALPEVRPINIDEYFKMVTVGILKQDEAVELIAGRLITMSPTGFFHSSVIGQLTYLFNQLLGDKALVWVQNSILLDNNTMPEPDLAIIKYRADFYRKRHVKADDVLLVIEVADSTLQYDKTIKTALYARFNIPEMWIVDVKKQRLICYSQPINDGYKNVKVKSKLKTVKLTTLGNVKIDLSHLF